MPNLGADPVVMGELRECRALNGAGPLGSIADAGDARRRSTYGTRGRARIKLGTEFGAMLVEQLSGRDHRSDGDARLMELEPVDGGEHERGSATVLLCGTRLGLGEASGCAVKRHPQWSQWSRCARSAS
eukprot:IDg10143t1